ncbi:uncharacterized protein [Linepithema humile]|uniref:uncharacterized protein n=1 Tax=Linepithema humile TaxID=83485 RepID=UPI00351E4882
MTLEIDFEVKFKVINEANRIQLGTKQLVLQLTKLGWLLCKQIGESRSSQLHNNLTICGLVRNEELQSQIERFWRIEDMLRTKLLSKEESRCEEIFQNEYKRTVDGRFEVSLPLREDPSVLGESKASALKRLQSIECRFRKNHKLPNRYVAFMDKYLKLGHMSVLLSIKNLTANYLPHHAVMKEASTSTKLREVFDASSPTTFGKSLNDCLLVRPTIQPELFEILIRFRQHPYVLTGDIIKMYRQIMVKPEDRQYQCILWRTKSDEHPTLNTVTYDTASAPFLAIRSLQQLAFDFESTHPRAAATIIETFTSMT